MSELAWWVEIVKGRVIIPIGDADIPLIWLIIAGALALCLMWDGLRAGGPVAERGSSWVCDWVAAKSDLAFAFLGERFDWLLAFLRQGVAAKVVLGIIIGLAILLIVGLLTGSL